MTVRSLLPAIFACAAMACSSSSSSGASADDTGASDDVSHDVTPDGDAPSEVATNDTAASDTGTSDTTETSTDTPGGHCCAADPAPGCCMHYGGWTDSADDAGCAATCDGMPEPGDPAWHLVKDEHGCDVWSSAGSSGPLCGAPTEGGFG